MKQKDKFIPSLRDLCKLSGFTMQHIAENGAGIAPNRFSEYISGRKTIPFRVRKALKAFLVKRAGIKEDVVNKSFNILEDMIEFKNELFVSDQL